MAQDILITPGSGEPQILFRGSGTTDTTIELNVISSYQSATGSGTALLFEGTEGQLFGVTDNLSSGTIFSVSDITGLPLIEVDASGDVKIGEYGRYVGIGSGIAPAYGLDVFSSGHFHKGFILAAYTPATTTNALYNVGGSLYFNSSAVGDIADDAIDSEHYADLSIDTAHIGNLQVTTGKIAADAIDGTKLADNAVDSEHYTDGSIDNAHIADDAIDSEHYADGSIDEAHIADDAVTSDKLAHAITAVTSLTAPLVKGSTSIQTPLIEYTDGDDAITIADGGIVTFAKATKPALKANADATTITFDVNEANVHTVTLGANRIFAISNETAGQKFIIRILQDGTGGRTVTWFSTIKWAGGSAPTLTTTASKADVVGFLVTGTDTYDGFIVGQDI